MLTKSGITILTKTQVVSIGDTDVTLIADGQSFMQDCDSVVIAAGYRAQDQMTEELEAHGVSVLSIGDCKKPGKILDAVHEAFHAIRLHEERVLVPMG